MISAPSVYAELSAHTLVPEPNSSYLSNVHSTCSISDPLSGSTMGLMMLLSTFQYQAPYMNPTYSNAASQMGKAAFVESGGQAFQDKLSQVAEKNAIGLVHSIGITDMEMGIVFGIAKVARDRRLDFNGPKIYTVKTNLTADQNGGSIGFKYEW